MKSRPRMEEVDLAVVGAGPAGAAAALAARRTAPAARVVLIDRNDFPRDKACGDGIAWHAVDVLRSLGAGDVVDGYPRLERLSLVGPGTSTALADLPGDAWVIPRRVFDARLVAAAEAAGAQRVVHRVRSLQPTRTGVVIDGRWLARGVIGADGANSVVRRLIGRGSPREGHRAVAVRGYVDVAASDRTQVIDFVAGPEWPAYRWHFPVGDGTANIGYGAYVDGRAGGRTDLARRLAELSGHPHIRELRGHVLPFSSRRPVPGRGRVLLAGDAASLVNPLSGEGIYYAVLSGRLAAESLLGDGAALPAYRRALARLLARHFRTTSVVSRLMGRPAFVDAAVAVAADDRDRFAELAELGLGRGTLSVATVAALARRLVADSRRA